MQRVGVDLRASSWWPYDIRSKIWVLRRAFETLIFAGEVRARLGERIAVYAITERAGEIWWNSKGPAEREKALGGRRHVKRARGWKFGGGSESGSGRLSSGFGFGTWPSWPSAARPPHSKRRISLGQ